MSPASTALSVVSDNTGAQRSPAAKKVAQLLAEAKHAASEEVTSFMQDLRAMSDRADQIVEMGDAVPAGIRDLARRMSEYLDNQAQTVEAIITRT